MTDQTQHGMTIRLAQKQVREVNAWIGRINWAHFKEECEPPGFGLVISFDGPASAIAQSDSDKLQVGEVAMELSPTKLLPKYTPYGSVAINLTERQVREINAWIGKTDCAHFKEEYLPPDFNLEISFAGYFGTWASVRAGGNELKVGEVEIEPSSSGWCL